MIDDPSSTVDDSSSGPTVLRDASFDQLEQAVANNHFELFCCSTIVEGGEVLKSGGLTWTFCGAQKEAMVAFPVLEEADAGRQLDEMMAYFHIHPPKGIGCWSLSPSKPADLGLRLLSRGFQEGWRPYWMALDLERIRTDHAIPSGLKVFADRDADLDTVPKLPYSGDNNVISAALLRSRPERVQRFIATLHGKIVGQSAVFFTQGEHGVAGLYNVGVVPRARGKGIGKAVVIAACLHAKKLGYRYVVLNGTGHRMYDQVGFQWINSGLTWWLRKPEILAYPPSPEQLALAEAVGKGDVASMEGLAVAGGFVTADGLGTVGIGTERVVRAEGLNKPLAGGMTLVQMAAHCGQKAAAEWLVERGADYSVLDAWDLGWKDRAKALLIAEPEQVNRLHGEGQITLLHLAAERNDPELAQLALSAKPELEIRDKLYNSTALGWAQHLQREEVARLIQDSM